MSDPGSWRQESRATALAEWGTCFFGSNLRLAPGLRHPISGQLAPRLIEALRHFLFDPSLPPDWATDMPLGLFRAVIGSQPGRDVYDGIPYRHQFHVLDRGMFHARVVIRPVPRADCYSQRAHRPLDRGARSSTLIGQSKPA